MNVDKFGRMSFDLQRKGGHESHSTYDLSVSNAALDAQTRKVINVATPNDPSDAANKAYVDNTMLFIQNEIQSLKRRVDGFDDHILQIYASEKNYIKMQDWDELFKEDFLQEKDKLIKCLLDLISGKIKRPAKFESADLEKINKTELLAILEAWRGK
jgi:hypothetical protein